MVPADIFISDNVSDLMSAAEYVAQSDLIVEKRQFHCSPSLLLVITLAETEYTNVVRS
jgi:hypothetical protein